MNSEYFSVILVSEDDGKRLDSGMQKAEGPRNSRKTSRRKTRHRIRGSGERGGGKEWGWSVDLRVGLIQNLERESRKAHNF